MQNTNKIRVSSSAFGTILDNRTFGISGRVAFNGKEKDDEIKGVGNSYDFDSRMFDPRIGRWLSCDPEAHKYSFLSSYSYVADNPLIFVDKDGKDLYVYGSKAEFNKFKAILEKEFAGSVELKRDKNNLVTMSWKNPTEAKRFMVDDQMSLMDAVENTQTYTELNKIISNEKSTKVELAAGKAGVFVGAFRGGTNNGDKQILDVNDLVNLQKAKVLEPVASIIHELEETFQDQVVNGSPTAKTKTEFDQRFNGPHSIALAAQAKKLGYDQIATYQGKDEKGNVSIFSLGINKDSKGNPTSIIVTVVTLKNGADVGEVKNYTVTGVAITNGKKAGDLPTVKLNGAQEIKDKK